MTAVIYLVIVGWTHGGIDHIPMKDMQSCQQAGEKLSNFFITTYCVEGIKP